MTRKKVKLVWIVNNSARKASLKKRRVGLLKKVSELTTLCDVSACVIIYSPDDNEPAVWPSPHLVQQMLARLYDLPEMERHKKMMNQEAYLRERVGKVQEYTRKNQRKNKEVEMSNLMYRIYHGRGFDELTISELYHLTWLVEEKINEIGKRYEFFQQFPLPLQLRSLPVPPLHHHQGLQNKGLQMVDAQIESSGVNPGGGEKRRIIPTEPPYPFDPWFFEIMNGKRDEDSISSVRSEMGLSSHHTYTDSSTEIVANSMGISLPYSHGFNFKLPSQGLLPPHGSFKGHNDMGLLLPPYRNIKVGGGRSSTSGIHDMGLELEPYGNINIGGGNNDTIGGIHDMGFGLQPYGNLGGVGGSITGNDLGQPFRIFGGSNGGGSEIGLPYDVIKTWKNQNFSP